MPNIIHPDPHQIFPIPTIKRTCFLKNIITNPQIIVGDYTYYDDPEDVYNFEKNVLYLFDFIGDRLQIGKFCQIAANTKFIMNGSIHQINSISTYPFKIFSHGFKEAKLEPIFKGDTIIGNDVWIGYDVTFMPGVKVSNGAIIGSKTVVTKDVPAYSVVGGNPAKIIKYRFSADKIEFLNSLNWWDWSIEKIVKNLSILTSNSEVNLNELL